MILTSGADIRGTVDTGQLFLYELLAEDGDEVWVKQLNSAFKGTRLTFKKEDLYEYREGRT